MIRKTDRIAALHVLVAFLTGIVSVAYFLNDKPLLGFVYAVIAVSWLVLAYAYWNTR